MTKRKNILVVSLVAILAAGAARAENASVTYVNTQDQKLADRIVTQDGRIKKLNDWVNPLKDGSRATLATEAQDAYRAINELKEAVDAIDVPAQVNADWNAESGVAQILNKPENLVNQDALDTALAGKMDKMTVDTAPTAGSTGLVTSGGVAAAITQAQLDGDVDLTGYATETYVDEKVAAVPAQVNADWNEADTTSKAYIANKPTIPTDEDIVSPSELQTALADKQDKIDEDNKLPAANVDGLAPVATSGDYADLTNTPTIPEQVNSDWNATEGVARILNKPTNLVTTDVLGEGFDSENTVAAALESKADTTDIVTPVQSDWNVTDADSLAYIANKPTNLVTTDVLGEGFDSENTVAAALESKADTEDIPAQVQSDWDVTDETSPAFIAHKPTIPNVDGLVDNETLTEALAGKQNTIDAEHKLPAANVDGLAPVATSGDYADLENTPTIPVQVQSNWAETDTTAPAFIMNKPEIYTKSEVEQKITQAALDGNVTVDTTLSTTSENPVQNKVVTSALPNYDTDTSALLTVPQSGAYVLGVVDGQRQYIAIVDGNGETGKTIGE